MDTVVNIVQTVNNSGFTEIFKTFAPPIASIITAGAAIWGLSTWKKQFSSKANYETARRVLRAIFAVRDEVNYFRSPVKTTEEMIEACKELNIKIEKYTLLSTPEMIKACYYYRWNKVAKVWSDFQIEYIEAETLWHKNFKTAVNDFEKSIRHLNAIFTAYIDDIARADKKEWTEDFKDARRTLIAFDSEDKPSPFRDRFNDSIDKAEEFLRKYIKL